MTDAHFTYHSGCSEKELKRNMSTTMNHIYIESDGVLYDEIPFTRSYQPMPGPAHEKEEGYTSINPPAVPTRNSPCKTDDLGNSKVS